MTMQITRTVPRSMNGGAETDVDCNLSAPSGKSGEARDEGSLCALAAEPVKQRALDCRAQLPSLGRWSSLSAGSGPQGDCPAFMPGQKLTEPLMKQREVPTDPSMRRQIQK